jgi:hypothetical protein
MALGEAADKSRAGSLIVVERLILTEPKSRENREIRGVVSDNERLRFLTCPGIAD